MLQSTDPERLSNKQGSRGVHMDFPGKGNRTAFAGGPWVERRERILGETTETGEHFRGDVGA